MSTVNLKWVASTMMVGSDSFGNSIVIGRWPEKEPQRNGVKPSDLLLLAAASCSTWDVVTILSKQKQPLESLEVSAAGEQSDQPPYSFTDIHLHYTFKGPIDPDKAAKAIQLSEEKYCSVINSFNKTVNVTNDFEIIT